jgi:tetratricopeptide (TPR) repeat protein
MVSPLQLCIDGLTPHQAGRGSDAERLYRQALDIAPDDAHANHCLALLLFATKRSSEAASCWRRVLAARPGHLPAMVNLANAFRESGAADDSIALCQRALAQAPRLTEAWVTLGAALLAASRAADAVEAYRTATQIDPDRAAAHAGLAIALLRVDQPATALTSADAAIARDESQAEGWFARGTALSTLGHSAKAIMALRRAVALAPDHAHAHLNLGNALLDLDARAEAEAEIRRAGTIDPSMPEAHASLGCLLSGDGRLAEAVAACAEAIRLRPAFPQAHWNLSFAHMLAGDFGPGWEEYEWRKQHPVFGRDFRRPPGPEWSGEGLAGRTMLVLAEQGFGDTIQFSRFLPALAARGARVILACARPLVGLLSQLAETVDRTEKLPGYDVWIDQMSLPRLFGTRVENIPAAGGYLRAGLGRSVAENRVGIAWAGNPGHSNDRRRSMPITALAPILLAGGHEFVSLQVGPASAEAEKILGIRDRSAELTDFARTADLIASLDLVITVDTAVAHLAGALGRPVFVLLPFSPDWRWMFARSDSPWYAAMTLFRQAAPGDWSAPVAAVAAALAARYTARVIKNPATDATAVTTVPHAMSISETSIDQPFSVDRLVMS